MNLKVQTSIAKIEETEYELPVYFNMTGEGFEDRWIKFDGKRIIKLDSYYNGFSITIEDMIEDIPAYWLEHIVSQEEFDLEYDNFSKRV